MDKEASSCKPIEQEEIAILKNRYLKNSAFLRFFPEVRDAVTNAIDELVCEVVFRVHLDLKIGVSDPEHYGRRDYSPNLPLSSMAEELDIIKGNQKINCPNCFVLVKNMVLTKHLETCMNYQSGTYSHSGRIARKRIQEGFQKDTKNDTKNDSNGERVEAKKRTNRGRKTRRY